MPGFHWIIPLLEKLLPFIFKRKEPVELVVDGFTNLADGQQGFISSLQSRLSDLEESTKQLQSVMRIRRKRTKKLYGEVGRLKKEIDECRRDRNELADRVVKLEKAAEKEKQYAHSEAHLFSNYMKTLEMDLEKHGVMPESRASILKIWRERQAEKDREQREMWGLPES